jgi:hypothetical protein
VFSSGEVMDGGRSCECPHSGREITDGRLLAGDAQTSGEVTSGVGDARATHARGEVSIAITATDVASLTAREVALSRDTGLTDVCVDINADGGGAGVNSCGWQRESSFGFSLSKWLA